MRPHFALSPTRRRYQNSHNNGCQTISKVEEHPHPKTNAGKQAQQQPMERSNASEEEFERLVCEDIDNTGTTGKDNKESTLESGCGGEEAICAVSSQCDINNGYPRLKTDQHESRRRSEAHH
ncbi:hypothetical protein DPEC_G00009590 [Dallia pectoralis]|uniref:Uncharacterized protein n=1 Tax=Dallia pectoralis TaxID=75939 RepID=A0ACC2HKV6_DALPE|nr:hypothetical protein DPEC_G00009590 [Dallia pectoralis]